MKGLKPQFATVEDAEVAYGINYFDDQQPCGSNTKEGDIPLPGEFIQYAAKHFVNLTAIQRLQLVNHLLRVLIDMDFVEDMKHFVPSDLLT